MNIKLTRWPWQEDYNWSGTTKFALLNNGARFGGGWKYKLGIDVGGKTILIHLLFGSIRISWHKKPKEEEMHSKRPVAPPPVT